MANNNPGGGGGGEGAGGPAGVDSEFEELDFPEDDGAETERDSVLVTPQNRWKKLAKEGLVIPYASVHEEPRSFKTPQRKCFIPGRPVEVKIIDVERTASTHFLNANLYVIQLKHGDHVWTIKRRYKHFQHLHQQLMLYRVTLSVPFPSRTHRERRTTYKSSLERDEGGRSKGLPRFPKRPEALVAVDHLQERREALEEYLQNLMQIRAFRNHHETLEFLEVSHLSFVHGLGMKGKEALVLKRTGTTQNQRCAWCCSCPCFGFAKLCGVWCGQWQRRWLIAKDTFVAYVRPKDGRLHCVMLFDNDFEVASAMYDVEHGIVISNLSRRLVVKCWTKRKAKEWLEHLRKLMSTEVARGFIGENRFLSFAPIRSSCDASWFVDGSSYMSTVADAMEAAHDEIYISDWWLSPEIYMKRPIVEGERWRLDKILQRKAKQGVKVFVLLYKEVSMALGINSYYSKQTLVHAASENIKVLRHPDHASAGILLWAHHEKLVIVDQTYAFVGGIDICYGRWDDHRHRLTDLGSVSNQTHQGMRLKITSSQPAGLANASLMQLAKATNMVTIGTLVDRLSPAPTPGILEQMEQLPAIDDEVDHVEAINGNVQSDGTAEINVNFTSDKTPEIRLNGAGEAGYPLGESESVESMSKMMVDEDGTPLKGETPPTGRRAQLLRKMTTATKGLKSEGKEWIHRIRRKGSAGGSSSSSESDAEDGATAKEGKTRRFRMTRKKKPSKEAGDEADGAQASSEANSPQQQSEKKKVEAKSKKKKAVNQYANTTMFSDSMGLQGSSKLWIGKDYTNFIVKDFADLDSPFTDLVDRSTTPRMPWHDIALYVQGSAARDVARHFIQRWNAAKQEKARMNESYPCLIPRSYDFKNDNVPPIFPHRVKMSRTTCQVLRSVSQWSAGVQIVEDSIQQAYIDAIQKAQHYVYIENQFFITLAQANANVQNRIGEALLGRILQAHREKKPFRVFVVIPLLPGFEGEVGTSRGVAIHAIVHWNYSSICRGPDSLFERLKREGVETPDEYITFHGLRTWSELHGDLVTELIYVHSKLLIVDDNLVICGSANINDRSMLGKRDSEVALIVQDEEFVQSVMNGVEYKAGKFGLTLRLQLFREHLGLLDKPEVDIRDAVSEKFYRNLWQDTAKLNTEIYDEVKNSSKNNTVFHVMPTDLCETFAQLQTYQTTHNMTVTDATRARTLLKDTRGYLVQLPLKFLCQENLLPPSATREALMPTQLWT
ncbi:Phospholipase D1 [Folsomia candida]|uniref:Phospholipase n=1 Tax=Folsomia candida TaxID=158441 RepID=A0A226DFH2_FOLCA|nr:Phospholipase D1 [Folsomia candida]